MSTIEITVFGLLPDADERAFLDADKELQTDVLYQHPGLLRRTTARSESGGDWLTIVVWRSAADADASQRATADHPVAQRYNAFVDASTVRSRRFEALD